MLGSLDVQAQQEDITASRTLPEGRSLSPRGVRDPQGRYRTGQLRSAANTAYSS